MNYRTLLQRIVTRLLRVFFYLLYQPMAWSYDLVAWLVTWGRWKDWVLTVLPYVNGPCVLELGHGTGHLQVGLLRKRLFVFGLDASHQMGQIAKKRFAKVGVKANLARGYTQKLPFKDDCFDEIVGTFPTEYIYAQETLQEVYRSLKPGGKLIVLPTAWITGKRFVDRTTETLFRVTGQAPNWDPKWLEPYKKAGFQTNIEIINQQTWSLIIISAQKPG